MGIWQEYALKMRKVRDIIHRHHLWTLATVYFTSRNSISRQHNQIEIENLARVALRMRKVRDIIHRHHLWALATVSVGWSVSQLVSQTVGYTDNQSGSQSVSQSDRERERETDRQSDRQSVTQTISQSVRRSLSQSCVDATHLVCTPPMVVDPRRALPFDLTSPRSM